MIYYNYIYLDPRRKGKYTYEGLNFSLLYEPFYIGKGKKGIHGERKFSHLYEASKKNSGAHPKIAKIRKIWKECNIDPYIIQINSNLEEYIALDLEIQIIKSIGRKDLNLGPLCNMTDGGDGGPVRYGKDNSSVIWWNNLSEEKKNEYRKSQSEKSKLIAANRTKEEKQKIREKMIAKGFNQSWGVKRNKGEISFEEASQYAKKSALKRRENGNVLFGERNPKFNGNKGLDNPRCKFFRLTDKLKNISIIINGWQELKIYAENNNLYLKILSCMIKNQTFRYNDNHNFQKKYKDIILYTLDNIKIEEINRIEAFSNKSNYL